MSKLPGPNLNVFFIILFALSLDDNNNNSARTSASSYGNDSLIVIDFFVDIMFMIDILINFRTTYINKKDEVSVHGHLMSLVMSRVVIIIIITNLKSKLILC